MKELRARFLNPDWEVYRQLLYSIRITSFDIELNQYFYKYKNKTVFDYGEIIEVLRKMGNVKLLAIHASTDTRFDFLQKRGRSDDPQTKEHFDERDSRELGVGISNSIALSDYAISNIGLTKDELIESAYEIIQSWV